MARLLILAFLGYLLYRVIKGFFSLSAKARRGGDGAVIDEMVQDPFCKTYIPRRESVRRVVAGREYRFCSDRCADEFEAERKT